MLLSHFNQSTTATYIDTSNIPILSILNFICYSQLKSDIILTSP